MQYNQKKETEIAFPVLRLICLYIFPSYDLKIYHTRKKEKSYPLIVLKF